MTKLPFDLKRLRADALKAREALPPRGAAGTVAAVRTAMPVIKALRGEGVPWAAIATALAAQGVTQGVGDQVSPLTRSRLTALVSAHDKREEKRAARTLEQLSRPDLVSHRFAAPAQPKRQGPLSLASELAVKTPGATPAPGDEDRDEEAIRRRQFALVQPFLKDD